LQNLKEMWVKKRRSFFLKEAGVKKLLIEAAIFILLSIIVVSSITPESYNIKVGDIAPSDIKSPKETVNNIATQKLQEEAADKVHKKYSLDMSITKDVENKIKQTFETCYEIRTKTDMDAEAKLNLLRKKVSLELTEESYNILLNSNLEDLKKLENDLQNVMKELMSAGIKEDGIDKAKALVIEQIRTFKTTQDLRGLGEDIALTVIKPNMVYDKIATEKAKWEAINSVEPVKISKGEIIVQKGHKITKEQYDLLKDLGLLAEDSMTKLTVSLGGIGFVLLLQLLGIIYMYQFSRDIFKSRELITLVGLIMIVILMLAKGVAHLSGYLIPVAAGSILIAILLNPQVAILINLIIAVLVGLITENNYCYTVVALIGGTIAVFSVSRVSQRSDLTRAGLFVAAANMVTIVSLGIMLDKSLVEVLQQSAWGIINGIFSAVLAIGFLPYLEYAFGITSSVKLLELSNPNHPLLKKLLVEAPGTYHHSIIVGNLAEAATEAVGGEPLLARAGAFYHDIGKLKRPYFFIENQLTDENPHDKISPSLSSLIITSHIKDGLEIAKKYKLPGVIQDIIAQHHGTTLLNYFYNKALNQEANNNSSVNEKSFTYQGPKPQTKEAAIVMLADCVEAAVRSMGKLSKGKIEGMVRKIIKDRLDEGQLDECDLTLKDLDKIARVFSKVLSGIFHTRIEYPDELSKIEGGKLNGDSDTKQQQHKK